MPFSKNKELNHFIYDLIIKQFKCDIINFEKHKEISTLAKWLPRQNSHFDKKIKSSSNKRMK